MFRAVFRYFKYSFFNAGERFSVFVLQKLFSSVVGRNLLFKAQTKNQFILCNTDEGLSYVANTSDEEIARKVFTQRQSFDSKNLINSLKLIGEKRTILLDVGANIGTIGISAVGLGHIEKCIAFEPEPLNFRLLSTNVLLNNLSSKYELHNVALSDTDMAALEFELAPKNFGDHRIRRSDEVGLQAEEARKIITVKTDYLDHVCQDLNLSNCILFMDAQGAEGHILTGAKSLIDATVPIITEFWPYGLKRADGLQKFYDALEASNYKYHYNLKEPDVQLPFTIDNIKAIESKMGYEGRFTDLLFVG